MPKQTKSTPLPNSKPRNAKYQPKVSEADIERTCTGWLALDGWRGLKTDPVSDRARGRGFGELGMADYLYIRYGMEGPPPPEQLPYDRAWCQLLWIEFKSKRGKAAEHQKHWHAAERARGALVLVAGEDFPKSIEGFQTWYRDSGLMRRNLR
jgi:hypothetical protein